MSDGDVSTSDRIGRHRHTHWRDSALLQAALGRRPDGVTLGHRGGAVAALAWVTADPALLGIAVAHGTFLIWDTAGEWAAQCQ